MNLGGGSLTIVAPKGRSAKLLLILLLISFKWGLPLCASADEISSEAVSGVEEGPPAEEGLDFSAFGPEEKPSRRTPLDYIDLAPAYRFIYRRLPEGAQDSMDAVDRVVVGYLEYKNYYFLDGVPFDERRVRNEGILRLKVDADVSDKLHFYAIPKLRVDDDDLSRGLIDEFQSDDPRRKVLDLEEIYLDIFMKDLDLRAGRQIYAFGKADAFNPTNTLSPLDLTDLLDDEDIGVFSLKATYYFHGWSLDNIFIPTFTPTRLPPLNSRFSFVPPGTPIVLNPLILPPHTLKNSQYAVRLSRYTSALDVAFSFYDGINDFPVPMPQRDGSITPAYTDIRVIGANFSTVFGKLGLRGEVGYTITDGDLDDDYVSYAVGADYTFNNVRGDDDLYVLIQYSGEEVINEALLGIDQGRANVSRAFTSAVVFRMEYRFSDFLTLKAEGVINMGGGTNYYVSQELKWEYSDKLIIFLGFDALSGSEDTFFGQFHDNDRTYLKLRYSF